MGHGEFRVMEWVFGRPCDVSYDCWHDREVYAGDDLVAAVEAMEAAKRRGVGCVTLQWRPQP